MDNTHCMIIKRVQKHEQRQKYQKQKIFIRFLNEFSPFLKRQLCGILKKATLALFKRDLQLKHMEFQLINMVTMICRIQLVKTEEGALKLIILVLKDERKNLLEHRQSRKTNNWKPCFIKINVKCYQSRENIESRCSDAL